VSGVLSRLSRPAIVLVAVGLLAGGLRFYELGRPDSYVFDEVYYAKDGCLYAGYPYRECKLKADAEQTWVHPPLGKWTIAAGEKVFGDDPFGWRVSGALFGTASVVLTALIALLLFRSTVWALAAGVLLATESLHYVQSRISMLDIFLAFWVALGFLFLVLDRRWIDRRTSPDRGIEAGGPAAEEPSVGPALSPGPGAMAVEVRAPSSPVTRARAPSPLWRPWRFAAGVALGAAAATKWSGAFALLGAGILALAWERTRRRRTGAGRPTWETIREESFGLILALGFVPIAVYLASYTDYFVHQASDGGVVAALDQFWRRHLGMWDFHAGLDPVDAATGEPTHPYMSRPWTWILLLRPVSYFFEDEGTEILGIGNPAVFWASLLAVPYLALVWWRRRDWRAGFLFVPIVVQYLPWLVFSRPQFLFYMTPVTPFLVLGTTYLLKDLSEVRLAGSRSRPLLPVAVGFVVLAVAMFAFFWPVLTAYPLSRGAWAARMWLRSWI
jgi:dolichyl-phosphate-mannose--protein O-mannosyl transferase